MRLGIVTVYNDDELRLPLVSLALAESILEGDAPISLRVLVPPSLAALNAAKKAGAKGAKKATSVAAAAEVEDGAGVNKVSS